MKPDVLIIGDSHSVALEQGCEALGIRALRFSCSGVVWHRGVFRYHGRHGMFTRRKKFQKALSNFHEELGVENLAHAKVPMLLSLGYHLGRLVPPFGWNGHRAFSEDHASSGDGRVVSSGFLEDYVEAFRAIHFRLIREFSRQTQVTVVAPPPAFVRENYDAFRDVISAKIQQTGAQHYDAKDDLTDGTGIMSEEWLENDNVHGNADYGRRVVEEIIGREYLTVPGERPCLPDTELDR